MQRHPELRWLAAGAALAAVAALVAGSLAGVFSQSSTGLPATGPGQLVAKVRSPHVGGYYGTVVARIDLRLSKRLQDDLTAVIPSGATLLRGSHTMRYWYGGTDQQRTAILSPQSEEDVFRNGSSVLTWDSRTQRAVRTTLDATGIAQLLPLDLSSAAGLTPPQLAARVLAMSSDSRTVLRRGAPIDDRPTYELVVRPESAASRIASVVIDVDGAEAVPLAVRVYARGVTVPAVDVAFQSITFGAPAAQNFTFVPPAGSVRAQGRSWLTSFRPGSTTGSDWTVVVSYRTTPARGARLIALFGSPARRVSGAWGRGRVTCVPIWCLLVTRDGRVLTGAVDASALIAAVR